MICTEASEAGLACACDAVSRHMGGPNFGNQEYTITLTCDRATDEFLGAINFRCVDQRHSQGKAGAYRVFFLSLWMPTLPETGSALPQCRDDSSVAKLYGARSCGRSR